MSLKKNLDVETLKNLLVEVEKYTERYEELLLNHQVQTLFNRAYQTIESESKEIRLNPFENFDSFKRNSVFSNTFWAGFYLYKKEPSAAKKRYKDVLSLSPDSPVGYGGLANVALLESDNLNLLSYYSKAKRSVGSRFYQFLQSPLSIAYSKVYDTGDPDQIAFQMKLFTPVISEYNNVLYSALGYIYLKKNRLDESEKAFERALNDEGSTANAHQSWPYVGLAMIAIQRGDLKLSDTYSKQGLEISNYEVSDLEKLAEAYAKVDSARAKALYKQIVSVRLDHKKWGIENGDESTDDGDDPHGLSNAYLQIGNLELAQGNFMNAKTNFKKVLQLGIEQHKAIAAQKMKALHQKKLNIEIKP